jgi:hypothetical protein
LSPSQQNVRHIKGSDLLKELGEESVLNANVLDYLLLHPEIIPEDWKGKYVYFWGTIYEYTLGRLYVRFLRFNDGRWYSNPTWLGYKWGNLSPAALCAS